MPPRVLDVVAGDGPVAGRALGLHPDVDVLAFTGSTAVGRHFLRHAADSALKRVWLEPDGKSPNIVLPDAPDPETGAVAGEARARSVLAHILAGREAGARLRTGGTRLDRALGGSYLEPTVLDRVTPDMRLARKEFGGYKQQGNGRDKSVHPLEKDTALKTTWVPVVNTSRDGTRPLIALPQRFSASASALRYSAVVTARALSEAVLRAGGEPFMLHPGPPEEVDERLARCDGVLLPGGGDLAPRLYDTNAEVHDRIYDVDAEQDAFDLAVARYALTSRLPLLAVCRGLQVVNVALGGTLRQDMGGRGHDHRHRVHRVALAAGRRSRGR